MMTKYKMIKVEEFGKNERIPSGLQSNAAKTVNFANEMTAKFPYLRWTSGYRSAARNKSVGGVPTSLHVQALAVDFVPNDGNYSASRESEIREFAAQSGFWLLVHDAGSGNHFHLEYNPRKLKKKV